MGTTENVKHITTIHLKYNYQGQSHKSEAFLKSAPSVVVTSRAEVSLFI